MGTVPQASGHVPIVSSKTNPLVWILLGVAGLILVAGIVVVTGGIFLVKKASENPVAAATLLAAGNRDLEVHLHSRKSSAAVPDWVPAYPGASVQGSFSYRGGDGHSASLAFTTHDSAEKVLAYYSNALKKAGFTVRDSGIQREGKTAGGTVAGTASDGNRNLDVNVSSGSDETTVGITYSARQ